jgi:hypothetical protein
MFFLRFAVLTSAIAITLAAMADYILSRLSIRNGGIALGAGWIQWLAASFIWWGTSTFIAAILFRWLSSNK